MDALRCLTSAAFLGLLAVIVCAGACVHTRTLPPCDASTELPNKPKDPKAAVVVAAGDIADCAAGHHVETAALVEQIAPDAVLTLGDTAYPNGSIDDFLDCYDPSWGRFRPITRAAVGNHEYHAPHAGPFFAYFCGGSGVPLEGRASFDIGSWHVVVLNSNCGGDLDMPSSVSDEFGGCGADSPQARWLKADLAAHPSRCSLAMWHHPRFSSGPPGNADFMRDTWNIVHDAGVELVLSGHAHVYERFAPMDGDGKVDPARGVREIVVGTGGTGLHSFVNIVTGSEVRNNGSHGVLRLELREASYAWRFVSVPGDGSFSDEGEMPCHD